MAIHKVAQEAESKFNGQVIAIALNESEDHGDFYTVIIKRAEPPCADRPYMSITGKYDKEDWGKGNISFHCGHYDLNEKQAGEAMNDFGVAV